MYPKAMRKKEFVNKLRPVPTPLKVCYDFSALFIHSRLLSSSHELDTVPNVRGVIPRWDRARSIDFEFRYFKTIVDDTDTLLTAGSYQSSPTLISFFSSQMIDIPVCLKRIKFAHSSSASIPKSRLITMLLRHGKRHTISKIYSKVATKLSHLHFSNQALSPRTTGWDVIYMVLSQRKYSATFTGLATPQSPRLVPKSELFNKRGELLNSSVRLISNYNWFGELLTHELLSYSPGFSFFVQSVNKLKRRHSRGKSGKYEIIWKYVPRYKRLLVVLRWLAKDVQFQKSRTLHARIEKSIENLLFNKTNHLVYQLRHFVHRFVFNRYRKTLLRTLHTEY